MTLHRQTLSSDYATEGLLLVSCWELVAHHIESKNRLAYYRNVHIGYLCPEKQSA